MLEKTLQVGSFTLKNRIIIPPIVRSMADSDGKATQQLIDEYALYAKSGASMLVVEAAYVMDNGRITNFPHLGITSDSHIEGLSKIADVIRKEGIPAILQLVHAGRMSFSNPFAPSPIAYENLEIPKEMTQDDIEKVKKAYKDAVRRAMDAGFDGVELHNAHGYLLSQFLSPAANKRTDQYGGSLENRSRLLFELVDIAKNTMPGGKMLSVRFGACDMIYGGLKLSEGVQIAKMLESKGVDLLDISIGIPQSKLGGSQTRKPMNFTVLSGRIKDAVGIPVAVAGKITTKEQAESVIESSKADLVALCRAILADPLWPKKAAGKLDKPFINCLGCLPRCSNYTTGCPLKK